MKSFVPNDEKAKEI